MISFSSVSEHYIGGFTTTFHPEQIKKENISAISHFIIGENDRLLKRSEVSIHNYNSITVC